jgi:chorismate mutase
MASPAMIAIRGAIQIDVDTRDAIEGAVRELCAAIERDNGLDPSLIISAFFTLTDDLRADFPARAAREAGWSAVPMLCAREIAVPGTLPRVCRVMLHVDRPGPAQHVYLRGATALRPDLAKS